MHLLGTPVNRDKKGIKRRIGASVSSPDSPA
jgi:hypothetical protein